MSLDRDRKSHHVTDQWIGTQQQSYPAYGATREDLNNQGYIGGSFWTPDSASIKHLLD